jgi:hypothetical protein
MASGDRFEVLIAEHGSFPARHHRFLPEAVKP